MTNPSIRTGRRGRRLAVAAVAAALLPVLGGPAQGDPLDPVLGDPGTTLPNLVPTVVDVRIVRHAVFDEPSGTVVQGPPELWFDTWAQNLGAVPLQLTFGGLENPETATADQCVSWRSAEHHVCREQRTVGGFSWHAEHSHFHFNEFAGYELRKLLGNGRVDYSRRGLLAVSDKVSFCLIDSTRVRDDAAPIFFYGTCSPTVEGISPGYADIYGASLPGQQLSLAGVPDGRYALIIRMDYLDHIHETDDTDNVLEATIELSNGVTQVAIVDRRYP